MGVRRNINSYQAMIYIKRQSTSLLLALASLSVVSSSLVSCSESMGISGVTLSDKKISFTATEVNGWTQNSGNRSNDEPTRTVGSYHPLIVKSDLGKPLYLHPVEQVGTYFYNDKDELVTRSGVPLSEISNQNDKGTRGTLVTSINTALGVSAVWNDGNGNSSQYFLDKKAALSNSNNISTWHTDEDLFWATNGTLDFYAYAPYSGISNGMLSVPNDGSDDVNKVLNAQTVHYVASQADIENQPDFIVAKNINNSFASTDAAKAYRGTRCLRKTSQTSSGCQSMTTASAIVGTKTTNYGSGYIQTTRLWNQGRRIKLRCPPKVLTSSPRPILPSISLD